MSKSLKGKIFDQWLKTRSIGLLTSLWVMRYRNFFTSRFDRFSTGKVPLERYKEDLAKEHAKNLLLKQQAQKEARAFEKDFIVSVLNSSVTKREAKSYIQRFSLPTVMQDLDFISNQKNHGKCSINLSGIYGPASIQDSPKFLQLPLQLSNEEEETLKHLALVKIRALQNLSDSTTNGIGRILSQLSKLGLTSIVVLDFNDENGPKPNFVVRDSCRRNLEAEQVNRMVSAINNCGEIQARLVDGIIGVTEDVLQPGDPHIMRTYVALPNLLAVQLRRGIIPIIPPVGYSDISQISLAVPASEVVLALTRELAGPSINYMPIKKSLSTSKEFPDFLSNKNLLDRLILLDPIGGIPTSDLSGGYHIFLNMEQEFEEVKLSLLQDIYKTEDHVLESVITSPREPKIWESKKLPIKYDAKSKYSELKSEHSEVKKISNINNKTPPDIHIKNLYHLDNLMLVRNALSILPSSSSAILLGPEEAANSIRNSPYHLDSVATRRQINPLIHNLLTDKPIFSSSLPSSRRRKKTSSNGYDSILDNSMSSVTFAKHGMPVTIFPDPKKSPWAPPTLAKSSASLTNSEVDLPRLIYLINDSFGRTLDVSAYLARVESRIAGIIVAGAYEGGAIITWESPPGVDSSDTTRMVPYLDKFAVLKRSQGSGGVADLIFNCMVRRCLPEGVVWRSRKNNPVNKWYFERSQGSWKLSRTDWTMFWTTLNLTENGSQLLSDYEAVCRSIQPTWSDDKNQLD